MKHKHIITVLLLGLLISCYFINKKINIFLFCKNTSYNPPLHFIENFLHKDVLASELNPSIINSPGEPINNTSPYDVKSENRITVYAAQHKGQINKKIFGNNFKGYYLANRANTGQEYFGNSNFGAGLWNPKHKKTEKEVIALAKNAGITIVRFPGGTYADTYNWKETIGNKRTNYLFGIDEFLITSKEVGAEVVFTVNYLTGTEIDAADLVEYLNSPNDGSNPNAGIDWAEERAKNGHPEPYKVKYFEIGNEVHNRVSSIKYAQGYVKYYNKMKSVDPKIKIGAVLSHDRWNRDITNIIKSKIDFGIIHTYPSPNVKRMFKDSSAEITPKDIFRKALSLPSLRDEQCFQKSLEIMKENAGKPVPLAITEHNGGFIQDKPFPYRHTLGTALINAELLRVFLKPENNILMANYWHFCNGYWGMIKSNTDFMNQNFKKPIWYIKRPNYYVYQLYNKHFGDILIDQKIESDTYAINQYKTFIDDLTHLHYTRKTVKNNLLKNKWITTKFTGVEVIENNNIIELNFKKPSNFNYFHTKKTAIVKPGTYYKLSGHIKSDNLMDSKGFCLSVWWRPFIGTTTKCIKGTTDWTYVEKVFKTPIDTNEISIIARRIGNKGPLKGKVFLKDVKLERFASTVNTNIPYLSVTSSKASKNETIYLMVINKSIEMNIEAEIILKDFKPVGIAKTYTLWGDQIYSTNDPPPHNNVRIYENVINFKTNTLKTSFKKHSLTAIEITGNCEYQ